MLQLFVQRGQSYDDIAALLGIERDEVRRRARAALTDMGGRDPDRAVGLADYLLGQADPIGRADAVRHLQGDPPDHELAEGLIAQLQLLAPSADLPRLPELRARRAAPRRGTDTARAATAPGPARAQEPRARRLGPKGALASVRSAGGRAREAWANVPRQRARAVAGLLAATILAVAVVLVVTAGDDNGGDGGAATTTEGESEAPLTRIPLEATARGSGSGVAVLGRQGPQAVMLIEARGLRPAGEGRAYVFWLYNNREQAIPLARENVGEEGTISGQAVIPDEVAPLIPQFRYIDVTIQSAREQRPTHNGRSVLRGTIPQLAPGPGGQPPADTTQQPQQQEQPQQQPGE